VAKAISHWLVAERLVNSTRERRAAASQPQPLPGRPPNPGGPEAAAPKYSCRKRCVDALILRNIAYYISGEHSSMMNHTNQLDRIRLCIVDIERCIMEARVRESSVLSASDQARVLVMLEQTLGALRQEVTRKNHD
jgi:hypothetical protein